jgi:hypothetical protein
VLSQITSETHFEGLDIRARASLPGHNAYGIPVSNPAAPVVFRFNSFSPGDGAPGQDSSPGADGVGGGNGVPGNAGACAAEITASGGPSIGIYGGSFRLIGTNDGFTIDPGGPGGTSPLGPGGNGLSAAIY